MEKRQAYSAVHRFLSTLRSDPEIGPDDVANFASAVRAVMDQTPPLSAAGTIPPDPRDAAEAALNDSIPVGSPDAPLLGGLIPGAPLHGEPGGDQPAAQPAAQPAGEPAAQNQTG